MEYGKSTRQKLKEKGESKKRMRVVMKFGGRAVADGERIKTVAQLIKRFKEAEEERKEVETAEIVTVTSALSMVTDALLDNAKKVAKEGNTEKVKEFAEALRKKHELTASEAISDEKVLKSVKGKINDRFSELEKALVGICLLGELTARSLDYISSFGERLAAPILAGTLRSIGAKAMHPTGGEGK